MKNYEHKECCNRHECLTSKRFTNHSHVDVNTKNKTLNRSRMKMSASAEKERKISPSLTYACRHISEENHSRLVSKCPNGHNHDKLLRPSSCTCPHGHYYEEEARPASCPNGHQHERKKTHASYTCPNGHTHGPTINPYIPPIQSNRKVPTTEPYVRKRKFYGIHVPREPLILPPTETFTMSSKEKKQADRKKSWSILSPQSKKPPFCKSYKNGKLFPLSIVPF